MCEQREHPTPCANAAMPAGVPEESVETCEQREHPTLCADAAMPAGVQEGSAELCEQREHPTPGANAAMPVGVQEGFLCESIQQRDYCEKREHPTPGASAAMPAVVQEGLGIGLEGKEQLFIFWNAQARVAEGLRGIWWDLEGKEHFYFGAAQACVESNQ